jgi:hypothetical protein
MDYALVQGLGNFFGFGFGPTCESNVEYITCLICGFVDKKRLCIMLGFPSLKFKL